MSELFFPQLFEHSRKIHLSLQGEIADIDERFIHIGHDNQACFQKLYDDIATLHPEAGNSYWRNRLWALLCWQPLYLAFISIYGFKTLPNLEKIGQKSSKAMVSGFRFSDEQHVHGEVDELVIIAAKQLHKLFDKYWFDVNQFIKLPKGLSNQLYADGILECLFLLKKNYPKLGNHYIQQQTLLWLESCGLPEKYSQYLYEKNKKKLKFIRVGCCLVYKCKRKKQCKNCPKKTKNKHRLKSIKTDHKTNNKSLVLAEKKIAKNPMYKLSNVSVEIDNKVILKNIDLSIEAKKITTILGHNGCGKSTLMQLLSRHLQPSQGIIDLNDKPLQSYTYREMAFQVSYLPQHPPITDGVTVRELVCFGRFPWKGAFKKLNQKDRDIVDGAIKQVGLSKLSHRFISTLSGGERQRAWMAMLLAQQSQVILLDEPTSSLDVAHQYELIKLIHELNQTLELTVVIVLHDINLASRFSDEVIALHSGEVIAQNSPSKIMNTKSLKQIYGLELGLFKHPISNQSISYIL